MLLIDKEMICTSYKNKTSTERCSAKALKNLTFCGKHSKVKKPRIWVDTNAINRNIVNIQKLWKGYRIRSYLKLCGPGVLDRTKCHNEEELFEFNEKEKQYPLDYFAFEEADKIYWFDFKSIIQWTLENPTNPYTKQTLTSDTMKRLRECMFRRELMGMECFHNQSEYITIGIKFANTWKLICQVLNDQFHTGITPAVFTGLDPVSIWSITSIIRNSMLMYAREHTTVGSRRVYYYVWLGKCLRLQSINDPANSSRYLGNTLLRILKDSKEQTDVCFQIISARHCVMV
jgi:hypothetical protein